MCHEVKDGAIIIADVHYNKNRKELENIIDDFIKNPPSQLFLAGDIFDLLIGAFPYLKKVNQPLIDKINKLGEKTVVYYFEGNHDFLLQDVFDKRITIFPIEKQPVLFQANNQKLLISHGDFNENLLHKTYTSLIRSKIILFFTNIFLLNFINNWFLKYILKRLQNKKICNDFLGFKQVIKRKIKFLEFDFLIEGHYHQNKEFVFDKKKYLNLPAFACNKSYIIVKLEQNLIKFEKSK